MAVDAPAIPVFRVGAATVLLITVVVIAVFGSLHLLATAKPEWTFSKIWLILGF